jgi:hypothetical protein
MRWKTPSPWVNRGGVTRKTTPDTTNHDGLRAARTR